MVRILLTLLVVFGIFSDGNSQGWFKDADFLNASSADEKIRGAIEYDGKVLYYGDFKTGVFMIAEWDGTDWVQFGSSAFTSLSGTERIYDAVVYSGELYIAGNFSITDNSVAISHIAKWDNTNSFWVQPFSSGTNPDGPVYALKEFQSDLYAGGDFTTLSDAASPNIASYDGTTWSNVGGGTVDTSGEFVRSFEIFDGDLIVGGSFELVKDSPTSLTTGAFNIASWDGSSWSRLGGTSVFPGGTNGTVTDMAVYTDQVTSSPNTYLAVAGDFSSRFTFWTGTVWTAPNHTEISLSGLTGEISMEVYKSRVFIGFTESTSIFSLDNTVVTGGWDAESDALENLSKVYGFASIANSSNLDDDLQALGSTVNQYGDPFPEISNTTEACPNQPFTITSGSTGSKTITSYNWTFEGADIASSTDENPTVTYATTGTFDITLEVSDGSNTYTRTFPQKMVVTAPVTPDAGPAITATYLDPEIELPDGSPSGGTWSGTADRADGNGTTSITTHVYPAITKPGNYTLTYTVNSGGCDASVDVPLTINKAQQTVTFDDIPDQEYTGDPIALITSTNGKNPDGSFIAPEYTIEEISGTGSLSNTNAFTYFFNVETIGEFRLKATFPENELFLAAGPQQLVTITKALQYITFDVKDSYVVGESEWNLISQSFYTSSDELTGLEVEYTSSDETVVEIVAGNRLRFVGAGVAFINGNQAGNENIASAATFNRTVTVEKGTQSITLSGNDGELKFRNSPTEFDIESNKGVPATYIILSGPGFFSGENMNLYNFTETGDVTISVAAPATDDYTASFPVELRFTVVKGDQIIDPGSILVDGDRSNLIYKPEPYILEATSSTGLPVTFEVASPNTGSISNENELTVTAANDYVIIAKQAGDDKWNAAENVAFSQRIMFATPEITFTNPGDQIIGATFELDASINSDQELNTATTRGRTSMQGLTGTIPVGVTAGEETISLTAFQNARYLSASESVTFCISHPKPTITLQGTGTQVILFAETLPSDQARWYKDGEAINSSGNQLTVSGLDSEGSYTVIGTAYDGCPDSEPSDPIEIIITDINNSKDANDIGIYPNPVRNSFNLDNFSGSIQSIDAVDMRGSVVSLPFILINNKWKVEATSLNNGSYILRIVTDKEIINKKITKE